VKRKFRKWVYYVAVAALFGSTFLFGNVAWAGEASDEPRRYSCVNKPYVGITVRTPGHDSFPAIDLRLTDDQRRTAGYNANKARIPNSTYHRVIEIPESPHLSKVVAVEVCSAKQGSYELLVSEHSHAQYILTLTGAAASGSPSLMLHSTAQEGRVCLYRFTFAIKENDVVLEWVDDSGSPFKMGEYVPCTVVR